jgi:hypothetical protein
VLALQVHRAQPAGAGDLAGRAADVQRGPRGEDDVDLDLRTVAEEEQPRPAGRPDEQFAGGEGDLGLLGGGDVGGAVLIARADGDDRVVPVVGADADRSGDDLDAGGDGAGGL